jgi:hypothetical protein
MELGFINEIHDFLALFLTAASMEKQCKQKNASNNAGSLHKSYDRAYDVSPLRRYLSLAQAFGFFNEVHRTVALYLTAACIERLGSCFEQC